MAVQRAFIMVWAIAVAALGAAAQGRQVMPSTPDSTPFYQGVTDEASLERIVEARLERANVAGARIHAPDGALLIGISATFACVWTVARTVLLWRSLGR